jgi:hypothetical protein
MCASTSGVGLAVGRARTDVVVEDESSNAASGTGGTWAGQSELSGAGDCSERTQERFEQHDYWESRAGQLPAR